MNKLVRSGPADGAAQMPPGSHFLLTASVCTQPTLSLPQEVKTALPPTPLAYT